MRHTSLKFSGWLLVFVALLCWGAASKDGTSGLAGPALGFLATGNTEIRPILGIPGAAHLGAAIALPAGVSKLYIAPGSSYAVVEESNGNALGVIALRIPQADSDGLTVASIPNALSHAEMIAFSPTGRTAVVYSAAAELIETIGGLPNSPSIKETLSTAAIPGPVRMFAVSDDGAMLLAANSTGVYSLQDTGIPPVKMAASALVFLPYSHEAVACDNGRNTVSLLKSNGSTFEAVTLSKTISDPAGISTSSDGQTIFVTSPTQHAVWVMNRTSGLIKSYPLGHNASQLSALAAKDVFLLSPTASQTYWIFAWSNGKPSSFFIGAPHELSVGAAY